MTTMSDAAKTFDLHSWEPWEPEPLMESGPARCAQQEPEANDTAASTAGMEAIVPKAAPEVEEGAPPAPDSVADATAQGYAEGHVEGYVRGYDEGNSKGYREGYDKGMTEGRAAGQAQARRLRAMAESCAASIAILEEETGEALLNLAIRIAEQILHDELAQYPAHFRPLLRAILQDSPCGAPMLTLRMHPDDEPLARELLNDEPWPAPWRLQADEHIERGGCIASSILGNIDATLATRWQRALASLGRGPAGE